jgi:hypothetical protein
VSARLAAELRRVLPTEEAGRSFVRAKAKSLLFESPFRAACALLPIKTKSRGTIAFCFDEWNQEQRAFESARSCVDIVLKPRQIGFSTLELARDVIFAAKREGVQVQIVSHDSDLCEAMFRTVTSMVDALVSLGAIPKPLASNVREVVFSHNGSAIRIVEAGQTERVADKRGRSGTTHRLHVTELAFWGAAEATMSALLGACTTDAEIVVESTPNGAAGLFYKLCTEAQAGRGPYRFHFFPWFQHAEYRAPVPPGFDPAPRDTDEVKLRAAGCDHEQIAWWRRTVDDPARGGRERVRQEYPLDPASCFRMPGGAYMDADTCDWLAAQACTPLETREIVVTKKGQPKRLGVLRIYVPPKLGVGYAIGGDVAEGEGKDESAFDVCDQYGATVATYAADDIEPGDYGYALAFAGRVYNDALVAPERNNHGLTTLRAMREDETFMPDGTTCTPYHRIYVATDGKPGWNTNGATRPVMFDALEQACRERAIGSPDVTFADQSRTLIRGPGGKPMGSKKGTKDQGHVGKDDRWIAKAIANQVRAHIGAGAPLTQPGRLDRRIW